MPRCRVSFTDPDGILHTVEVDADSLYEAVAHAVAEFRNADPIKAAPGPMTEFTVTVYRRPIEHRIRMTQVEKWAAEHTTKEGPDGITKRDRVRKLLEASGPLVSNLGDHPKDTVQEHKICRVP